MKIKASCSGLFALVLLAAVPQGAASAEPTEHFRTRLVTAAFQSAEGPYRGDGTVEVSLAGRFIEITGNFKALGAPVTRLRLLSGIATGVPDGVEVALVPVTAGSAEGTISARLGLTAQQARWLREGRMYLQVETTSAPEGALWGWLLPSHPFPGENVPEARNWQVQ